MCKLESDQLTALSAEKLKSYVTSSMAAILKSLDRFQVPVAKVSMVWWSLGPWLTIHQAVEL